MHGAGAMCDFQILNVHSSIKGQPQLQQVVFLLIVFTPLSCFIVSHIQYKTIALQCQVYRAIIFMFLKVFFDAEFSPNLENIDPL